MKIQGYDLFAPVGPQASKILRYET